MALSIAALRHANPQAKPYKLADEQGLFLLVQPSGGMLWRFKCRVDGRDAQAHRKVGLSTFPDVGLQDARALRGDGRALLAKGRNPMQKKRRDEHVAKVAAANTFASVTQGYIDKCKREGRAEATTTEQEWLLQLLDRTLGQRPVSEVEPFEMLETVRRYETTKRTEAAHRALQFASQMLATPSSTNSPGPTRHSPPQPAERADLDGFLVLADPDRRILHPAKVKASFTPLGS